MRITFLLPTRGPGGGVRAIVRFAREFLTRGYEVRVFYGTSRRTLRTLLRQAWVDLRYGRSRDWITTFPGVARQYRSLHAADFAPDDIILAMCTKTTLDTASLPEGFGIGVLHSHGTEPDNWEAMVQSWKLLMPKIAISQHLADVIRHETGQEVVGIVPDGVDLSECYSTIPCDERNGVGASYRRGFAKDPETTLAVVRNLRHRLPAASFHVFSPERKPWNLPSRVHYTRLPSVAGIRKIYNSCKVWYLASRSEGFGMTVLEAMACGCAVVATDCGGPSDVIMHGINGFLVDVGDVDGLVESICLLYRDDDLRRRICEGGHATAQEFGWQNAAAKLESCLLKIHGNHDASGSTRAAGAYRGVGGT